MVETVSWATGFFRTGLAAGCLLWEKGSREQDRNWKWALTLKAGPTSLYPSMKPHLLTVIELPKTLPLHVQDT